jgi:hypothetical protein
MQHFAELDNENTVLRVIVVADENCKDKDGNISEEIGCAFCNMVTDSVPPTNNKGRWVITYANGESSRKNFAGRGDVYDPVRNAFIAPVPYDNWVLNEELCMWEPPIAKPDDGLVYNWNQEENTWVQVL